MTTRRRIRLAFLATALGLPALAGCDFDNSPTATGKVVQPPGTTSAEDPGKVNAGGPGNQGQLPK